MDRRDFLRSGLAGAALVGCGRPAASPPSLGDPDARHDESVEAFLRRIEQGRTALAGATPLADLFEARGHDRARIDHATFARNEKLFRGSLDSLLLTSAFHDLPPAHQRDHRVQRLMVDSLDGIDEAVIGVADHLEKLGPTSRKAIGERLRRDPNLALDLFDAVDAKAKAAGVDPRRRMHLRTLATQVAWRLEHQPVALFVDEHVDKVKKLAESQHVALLEKIRSETAEPEVVPPGTTTIRVGAIMLGISVVVGLTGVAIASGGNIGGLFVVTAGVLGAIAGLITLLVGLIIRAAS